MSAESRALGRRAEIPSDGRYVVRQFRPPIRRWKLASWWDGLMTVGHGVPLRDYLNFRLRRYESCCPQIRQPQPSISVEGTEIRVVPNPNPHPLAAVLDAPPTDSSYTEHPRAAELRFLKAEHEARALAMLRGLEASEREIETLTERLAVPQQAELQGRPRMQFPWELLWLLATGALALIAEGWALASSAMNWFGIDSSNLAAEWHRNPLGVALTTGVGVALVVALLWLFRWLFDLSSALFQGGDSPRRTWMRVALVAIIASAILTIAWSVGQMREGLSEGATSLFGKLRGDTSAHHQGGFLFVLLTIVIPCGLAYAENRVGKLLQDRARIRQAQQEWDRRESEVSHLETKREHELASIRALEEEAQAAEHELRATVDAERRFTQAYVSSLVAALAQDRFYFLKQAAKRGLAELVKVDFAVPGATLLGPRLEPIQIISGNGRGEGANLASQTAMGGPGAS